MEKAFLTAKYLFFNGRRDFVPAIPEDVPRYIDLTFCLEGEMDYFYNGKAVRLLAGDAILYPVGSVRERCLGNSVNNYASFNLILSDSFTPEVEGYIPRCVSQDIISMLEMFKRVNESASARKTEKQAAIFSYIYHSVVEAASDRENAHVKLTKQYLLSHLAEDIRLEEVAEEVHLAPNYLCAVFKKSTGRTVMQYLAEQRIDLAKRLILTHNDELYKISELCGFSDYIHFSHTFKKVSGVSPMHYRKMKK